MPYEPRAALAALALLVAGCPAGDTSVLDEGLDATDAIPANELLEAMSRDLATIAPTDRANVRYVTLAHLDAADLPTHRAAISLTLNSLSSSGHVTEPAPVDQHATIFRIRLDDYGWDASIWQRLVDRYPYNVRYDEYAPWFELRGDLADELRAATASPVPYIHGDWLVAEAMQPTRYYDLLGLPDTLDALAQQLGLDTADATNDERVARAGFAQSDVSTASRMIARFALSEQRALWTACDLADGSILDEPIDPVCEGAEVLFTLPNGLPAYYAASPTGERQDTAGLSCAACHGVTGVIPKLDEVRAHALLNGAPDLATILALYPTHHEMSALMTHDQDTFLDARRASGAPDTLADPLAPVSAAHDAPLTVPAAAAALGLDEPTFRDILAASLPFVPPEALALRRSDGTIPRATWNRIFGDLVSALALGTPCDPYAGALCSGE